MLAKGSAYQGSQQKWPEGWLSLEQTLPEKTRCKCITQSADDMEDISCASSGTPVYSPISGSKLQATSVTVTVPMVASKTEPLY